MKISFRIEFIYRELGMADSISNRKELKVIVEDVNAEVRDKQMDNVADEWMTELVNDLL